MIKTVIFDFNGTLVDDNYPNKVAWLQIIKEIVGDKINIEEFYEPRRSVRNYLLIKDAFEAVGNPQSDDVINAWAHKKEEYYQKYIKDNNFNQLRSGAIELLDYIKGRYKTIGLCTSSILFNTNFYYSNYGIGKWFDMEHTVYDTGEYNNKVMMYQECARRLGVDPKDVLVFEDTAKSINEAIKAGCQNVVAINNLGIPESPEIKQFINDFTEFDKTLLDK